MREEIRAQGLDERDHYKFCRLLVAKAADDWPDPYIAAFYYHYGKHPSKLIPEWQARETFAKSLGQICRHAERLEVHGLGCNPRL
jgi:hypothetical protein